MVKRARSNLKQLLDEREMSIRKLSEISGLKFETLRRMYNDETKQYQRDTLGRICEVLGVRIEELLEIIENKNNK